MSLTIYNVLAREKQVFTPIVDGQVMMYVCGPTVYDYSHLGHAKTYVSFDIVNKWLRYSGYKVRYVQNITDVGHLLDSGEDRILKRARQTRVEPMELVETYMREYFADMDALGVARPDISPRASAHVPEQIEMIQMLIAKGNAYESNGSVYFSVESDPDYGKLSGRRIEENEAGKRIAVREDKRHPMDFALWIKAEEKHILQWASPWGRGYPGWHIECSAMAVKYLGQTFDLHGGGIDNIFPHNECEIAQSECAHDAQFANYWMLTGSLNVDGVKMSKSLGNFVTIKDALKEYRPEALRFFISSGLYRTPADYSASALDAAAKGYERLNTAVRRVRDTLVRGDIKGDAATSGRLMDRLDQTRMQFTSAMNDDFNAPIALSVLFDLSKDMNSAIDAGNASRIVLEQASQVFKELGGDVLGVVRNETKAVANGNAEREAALIEMLLEMRLEARKAKDFARSDAIRDRLSKAGVVLEDGVKGTSWRIA
ncbi:MAG: cysteine--tRNA ligase [Chloroflexi bacterium]|jgi:cysteinyl-tRNA synthetase|nr:cysteine--tRNA ligase [Chloroflexota bacterium]